jgi:Raf kinase inhibitor-like YbhB/YbcL family protein
MDDEDPPCGTGADACRHWALFNIPAAVTTLDAGVDPDVIEGVTIGMAYDGKQGYAGPCPPSRHTYSITVFALDAQLPSLPAGLAVTRSSFREEYGGHILDEATLTGWFSP